MNKKQMLPMLLVISGLIAAKSGTTYASENNGGADEVTVKFEATGESQHYAHPDFDAMDAQAAADLLTNARNKCGVAHEIGPRTTEW